MCNSTREQRYKVRKWSNRRVGENSFQLFRWWIASRTKLSQRLISIKGRTKLDAWTKIQSYNWPNLESGDIRVGGGATGRAMEKWEEERGRAILFCTRQCKLCIASAANTGQPLVPTWSSSKMPSPFVVSFLCPRHRADFEPNAPAPSSITLWNEQADEIQLERGAFLRDDQGFALANSLCYLGFSFFLFSFFLYYRATLNERVSERWRMAENVSSNVSWFSKFTASNVTRAFLLNVGRTETRSGSRIITSWNFSKSIS